MNSLLRRISLSLTICCASAGLCAAETEALPFGRPAISQLHARWLVRDGAPPQIGSIAQTPDGWIWLASSAGLFRFDGATFTKYQAPAGVSFPGSFRRLGVLADGTLWISPYFGNLYFLRDGVLRFFDKNNNMPVESVQDVVQDQTGRTWLASNNGLRVLGSDGKHWLDASVEAGLPHVGIHNLLLDKHGTLWAQGSNANYARWPGRKTFVKVSDQKGWGALGQSPDGTVWASDLGNGGLRRLSIQHDDPRHQLVMHGLRAFEFTVDRRGNMWFPVEGGVLRVDMAAAHPELRGYTMQQGLSGHKGMTVLEDREGNVWVATSSGLDQFRDRRIDEVSLPPYFGPARPIAAGPAGELWIDHVFIAHPGAPLQSFGPASDPSNLALVLYRDRHGVVWSADLDGLWRLDGLQRIRVPLPAALAIHPQVQVYSIALDDDDGLWISGGPRGTWRLKGGVWEPYGNVAGLAQLPVTAIVPGPGRSMWFASVGNTLAVLRDGTVHRFGSNDGIDVGTVMQVVPHGEGAYLGGDTGLAFFDGRHAFAIRGKGNERFSGTSGVVVTPSGDLWANTGMGLVNIPTAELGRALIDPRYEVRYRRFDENDGLAGTAPPLMPLPSLVLTAGGELIASTDSGVFRFDPMRARANQLVPPVEITAISADGMQQSLTGAVQLPSAPDMVRIDYTALSLSLPRRVRFQYLLMGVDSHWQEAGARRAAYYTALAPGKYTFRVLAANDDGLWNRQGATLVFEIPPTMTQTLWFKLFCAMAVALAAWGWHRLRVRAALQRQERTFETRVAERERIARDLHDTLLQSVQALILMFRRIALRTPDTEPAKEQMNSALALALEVMQEGRDKVQGLRMTAGDSTELGADIEAYGRRMAEMHAVAFSFIQPMPARPLLGTVHDELLALAHEAIRNAFIHANATHIDATLEYGSKLLQLSVRDDGRGIDAQVQEGRPGHWGIPGMRERAAHLGADLTLASKPGEGSVWHLRLAARLAYAQERSVQTPDILIESAAP
jgi:signal transduction histidine kinase/ligand-binding sensor domain-containing protein